MATRTRKVEESFFNDKIDILNKMTVDASPAQQVYRKVGGILALLRVGSLVLCLSVDSHSRPNQDKMIGNNDSEQLSKYCFDVCVALETAIQGEGADDLSELARMALADLER